MKIKNFLKTTYHLIKPIKRFKHTVPNQIFGKYVSNETFNEIEKKARKLIWQVGRTYKDFTPEEKKIVDSYQSYIEQESCGCLVLPNTGAEYEQIQFSKMLREKEEKEMDEKIKKQNI